MSHGRTRKSSVVLLVIASCLLAVGCGRDGPASLAPLPSPHYSTGAPGFRIVPVAVEAPTDQVAVPTDKVAPPPAEWACEGVRPWKYIVIHHSATERGNAEVFDRRHRERGFDELGYHFVINNGKDAGDGAIEPGRRWRIQKWGAHTGGTPGNEYNNYGIGICLVGDFTERLPSRKQMESLRRLVAHLMGKHGIAATGVVCHCDAPNASTACPGKKLHAYIIATLRPELARLTAPDRRSTGVGRTTNEGN
jgi:hypothetical protein